MDRYTTVTEGEVDSLPQADADEDDADAVERAYQDFLIDRASAPDSMVPWEVRP